MSLASSRSRMEECRREMRLVWADIRRSWSDPAADSIERERIDPLDECIRNALLAIERMEHCVRAVQRETQGS